MILQGSPRGGAKNLALHLLKDENEHVDVHDLRGFVSDNLVAALNEAYAVSRGTRAKQFLFSLSLNPPPQAKVGTDVFEDAIERVEQKLGLDDQPRAIVFHEKGGRRHAHAVWSRIDIAEMKAVQLSFTKRKLMDISRELFMEHGWTMPAGMIRGEARDPKNYTLAEWQQAKRRGKDARTNKAVFQDCWAASDGQVAFAQALAVRGYVLARGDRRGFVALDCFGEPYAVAKWVGIRAKEVRAKLTDPAALPSISEAKARVAEAMTARLDELRGQHQGGMAAREAALADKRRTMISEHRAARRALAEVQAERTEQERVARQARFRQGIRGLFDRFTGRHRMIRLENEREAEHAKRRDRQEKDALIFRQLEARRALERRRKRLEALKAGRNRQLNQEMARYQATREPAGDATEASYSRRTREAGRQR